jgi:hypothetical protein
MNVWLVQAKTCLIECLLFGRKVTVTSFGETHEFGVVLDIQPKHLQIALLLFGLEYGNNLQIQGDTSMILGDPVLVCLPWADENKATVIYTASELMLDFGTGESTAPTSWVFKGLSSREGYLVADLDGSITATNGDRPPILNETLVDRIDDTVYGADEKIMPAPGKQIFMKTMLP